MTREGLEEFAKTVNENQAVTRVEAILTNMAQ